MRSNSAIVVVMLLGVFVATGAAEDAPATAAAPVIKNLLLTPLAEEFTAGREVLVDLVEIPANFTMEQHWHPGEEFHYYLEGEVEIKIEGAPSIIGTPGTVGHVPFQKRHQAIAGAKGAKILVFRVHTKGAPWRYVDEKPAAGK